MNLKAKFMNLFRENVNISKKILAGLLAFMIMLSPLSSIVNANSIQPNSGTTKAVTQGDIPAPTITKAFIGTNTISGGNVHRGRINNKPARGTVYVTLKDSSGNEKATVSFTPKSGTTWSVNLPAGVTIAEGDTVTAYQEFNGQNSPVTTENAMDSLAKQNKDKLKMPTGEIWIEQTSSNIVNEDEQAEAVKMLKDANTAIVGDIESVKFSIVGTDHAYYEVTYTDGSTSGKVEATDLKIKQVIEYSRKADLNEITIVDNVVKGKLPGPGPFYGIKVQLIINVKKEKSGDFCTDKGCKIDKDSSTPVVVTLEADGTFSYTLQEQNKESLTLDQIVGVTVKEPHKFVSCSTTTVKPVIPEKTEVKDPRKLTAENKTTIINAIKEAYKAPDGTSKLPHGTGDWDEVPAVIQFDDSGNAKIFSGNDVAGRWDSDRHYVPEKNADGSLKVKEGAKPTITIPAKDLLKNIKPDAPTVALSDDKKNITITPNEKDTDANIITVSYTDKDGKDQTTTATKADDGTWSIVGEGTVVNGVITLPKDKVKGKTDVKAKVTDKGGVADDDKTPLTSDFGTLTVEETKKETKADKVRALGGLDPVVMKKWVKDKLDWKDGVKVSDSASDENKAKIKEFLDEAGTKFTDETTPGRNTDTQGDYTGTIKVTFDDGSFIEVKDQKLYVSNHVTWFSKEKTPGGEVVLNENTPDDALVVEFKLGEGTKVDNTTSGAIEGNKDNPVSYQKYKVKPNTDLKTYKNPILNETYYNLINSKVKAIDKYTEPVWNGKNGSVTENFIITESNKVFTATATKTYDITFDANTGGGTKDKVTQKANTEYELPASNTFTPPANKEFSGWQVGDDSTNLKQPGEKIKITGDTIVKAIWKDIEHKDIKYKVTFNGNNGTGSMDSATVKKGEKYKLPENTFGAPSENQEFKTWEVDGKEVAPGTEITIEKDTEVKAIWKGIMIKITYNPNGGNWNNYSANKTIEVKKGTTITIMKAPVKDGFKFKYWKGSEYQPGDNYTAVEDHTFIAVWEEDKNRVLLMSTLTNQDQRIKNRALLMSTLVNRDQRIKNRALLMLTLVNQVQRIKMEHSLVELQV